MRIHWLLIIALALVFAGCEDTPTELPYNYSSGGSVTTIPVGSPDLTTADMSDWGDPLYVNNNVSSWGGNDLNGLYLLHDTTNLYVAVTGDLTLDNGGNKLNIYLDTDYGNSTGTGDFSSLSDSPYNVSAPLEADVRLSASAAQTVPAMATLSVEMNSSTGSGTNGDFFKFKIPFTQLYGSTSYEPGSQIGVIVFIGGGGAAYVADDTIPQQTNQFTFTSIFLGGLE